MQYILILRELTDSENVRVQSLGRNEDVQIVGAAELAGKFPGSNVYSRLDEEEKKRINEQVFSSILQFGDKVIDGKTVSQHLNISGAGVWYYHKFRILFNIREQEYLVAEMNKNLRNASSAIIYCEYPLKLKEKVNLENIEVVLPPKKRRERINLLSVLQYGITVTCRLVKSVFTSKTSFNQKKYLCIDSVSQYRNMLSLDGSSIIFENVFTGYLYQKKGDELGFIDQLLIPKFKGKDKYRFDLKHLKNHNKRDRILGEFIISKALLSASILKKVLASRKELNGNCRLIEQHLTNDPIQQQILTEFVKLNTTTAYYLLKYFAYLRFFQAKKFRSIITVDENSANFKIILDAAKQQGIYTVGYQHGNISRFSPNYMYSKVDLTQKPMPDCTITWGAKWVDLLQNNGNYASKSLEIAGQIRTDVIESLDRNSALNREAIVPEITDKHIVLFATQPQKDESLRYRAAEDAVVACKNIDSVHLILKLHPRELDPEFYIRIADKHQFQKYSIIKDKELYLLLKISDVVITCFSTVGTEALYFHKPLIILDHLKEDVLDYFKDGVAFQATNARELQDCIEGILIQELSLDQSVLADYLKKSTYKVDGLVSERVWDYTQTGRRV